MIGQGSLVESRACIALSASEAGAIVADRHYLHRAPSISWAFGLIQDSELSGVVTFGVPASRHLQMSACPSNPDQVIELNRLWTDDRLPRNSGSWFVSRALRLLPALIVVSYADPAYGHTGYIYRALNFRYAGWTDMDRLTPRLDYLPMREGQHTREATRSGVREKVRRVPKVRYWTVTGNRTERRRLAAVAGWPSLNWNSQPPPTVTA